MCVRVCVCVSKGASGEPVGSPPARTLRLADRAQTPLLFQAHTQTHGQRQRDTQTDGQIDIHTHTKLKRHATDGITPI